MDFVILRIDEDRYIEPVFGEKRYYTAMKNLPKEGDIIFFLHNDAVSGDSIVGVSQVKGILSREQFEEKDIEYCRDKNWDTKLLLENAQRLDEPLPLKETILYERPNRGKTWQGLRITEEEADRLLRQMGLNL